MTQIDSDLNAHLNDEIEYVYFDDAVEVGENVNLEFDGEYVLADEADEQNMFIVSDHAVDLEAMI